MAAKGKSHRESGETETTPDGLTALIYHITHAAAQKQLGPEFARRLGKQIESEYQAIKSRAVPIPGDFGSIDAAMYRFQSTVLNEEGQLLTKALTRLRGSDRTVPEGR